MLQIATSTLSNQSLATALLCHTYTADADRQILIRLFADQVAGNGAYVSYVTIQRLGAGSAYEEQPRTSSTVASGITSIGFTSIPIPVKVTDVVKVYLLGLAGDTTTPDIVTEIWDTEPLAQFHGTAQAGGNNTITLSATNSPATDDLVNGSVVRIIAGTGAGQARVILSYVTSTKIATVGRNWKTNPDSTSVYYILSLSVPRVDDSLQVYPLNSAGVTSILADYARRTGDYATVAALSTLQGNVTSILADYARRTGDYSTYAGGDTAGTTTLLSRLSAARAGYLDNLNSFLDSATSAIKTVVDAIKSKTDLLNFTGTDVKATLDGETVALTTGQILVKRNTALNDFPFTMNSSTTHLPGSGLTVTGERSIDGGAFAPLANTVVEMSDGWYSIDFAASDLNGTTIAVRMSATGGDDRDFTIVTQA